MNTLSVSDRCCLTFFYTSWHLTRKLILGTFSAVMAPSLNLVTDTDLKKKKHLFSFLRVTRFFVVTLAVCDFL